MTCRLQNFATICLCGHVQIILLDRTGMDDIWEDLGEIWERFWRCLGILANKHEFQDGSKQLQAFATVKRAEKHLMFAKAKSRTTENENKVQ